MGYLGPNGAGKSTTIKILRFLDGQLYVDLHGYSPSGAPLTATEALHRLLLALGTVPDLIPPDAQSVSALFRSLLAGKRMLLIVDNALHSGQVRPLLPAAPGCLVIVTSRSELSGLVARDGARPLTLDVMTPDEAIGLLAARIGRPRVDAEPTAAASLTRTCAGLPLAVVIVAARAASRPHAPLSALADEMHNTHLLDAPVTGDTATDARTVFSWSYQQLPASAARMFRLLGLHPGPDITVPAAASLADTQLTDARRLLGKLSRESLLSEHVPGRFAMHDLLRAYAAALARTPDSDDPGSGLGRLFDYYLSTAGAAMNLLHPAEARYRPPASGLVTAAARLDTPQAALAWLNAERACLVAVVSHAAAHGWPQHAVRLSATMERYVEAGHYSEGLSVHEHARDAARRATDLDGEASALRALGALRWRLGSGDEATDHASRALSLFQRTGNRLGQARCLLLLGALDADRGASAEAIEYFEQSIGLFRQVRDANGESAALNNLADLLRRLGHTWQATHYLHQALTLSRREDDRNVEAHALQTLGEVAHGVGQPELAADYYWQALAVFTQIGHRRGEAWILARLGTALNDLGHSELAREYHRKAMMLSRKSGDRNGEAVALNGLGEDALTVGQPAEAKRRHASALALSRATGDLEQQARAHRGLGHAHEALSQPAPATIHFQQAFELYSGLGYPEARQIHAKLADLDVAIPPPLD